jgi:hypothetical protein
MNEPTKKVPLQKKKKVPRKSEVFYLATDSYHITGHVQEHMLPVLYPAFSPIWSEVGVPEQGPRRFV